MEKIRRIIIIFTIVLLSVNCKTKSNKEPLIETENQEFVLKQNAQNFNCSTFVGKWSFIHNNKDQDFHLELKKGNSGIVGGHCFIKGINGDNIDCSTDQSIFLNCDNSIAKGEIESVYADDLIKVEFKLITKDTLKLKTLNDIGFSFFYDGMLFVKK